MPSFESAQRFRTVIPKLCPAGMVIMLILLFSAYGEQVFNFMHCKMKCTFAA